MLVGYNRTLPPKLSFAVHTLNSLGCLPAPERLIFAVDDSAGDLLLLARLLEQPGLPFPCRLFSSGEKVMDALLGVLRGAPTPLVCFIDVTMAGMSGFDVLRWIRCQDAFDSVPVIMLSSSDDPQHMHEACGVGAQCYVRKFPSGAELRNLIVEARNYTADRAAPPAFRLPCNLLLNLTGAARHPVTV
jgi:CheY-like chemotaxis protein